MELSSILCKRCYSNFFFSRSARYSFFKALFCGPDRMKYIDLADFSTRDENVLDLLLNNKTQLFSKCQDVPRRSDHQSAALASINCHPIRVSAKQNIHTF